MSIAKQLTGMRGVYLVAAELSRIGLIASPTSRSAIGADILVTDQACLRTYSVQVKTNASTFGFWLVGAKARTMHSPSHVYVLVNLRKKKTCESIEYYIVPSEVVATKMVSSAISRTSKSEWHQFNLTDAKPYLNDWAVFGATNAAT